ncbi:MAG: hypothetical protein Kow0069_26480 [Promethearchaeota archaeon]
MYPDRERMELVELCAKFFERRHPVSRGVTLEGKSGQNWKFDLLVEDSKNGGRFGVFVRDWKRAVGINQVRRLEKACRDCQLDGAVLVGNLFGVHAKTHGERIGVQVLYRSQIERKLGLF